MNETCSENETEDDEEDELRRINGVNHRFNGDDDSNLDRNILDDDDDVLFQPARRPAEIKKSSRERQRRQVDLHEEIKQISTVIQDLVQTMNAAASSGGDKTTAMAEANVITTTTTTMTSTSDERKRTSTGGSSIPVLRQRVLTKQRAAATAVEETTFKTTAASTTIESFVEFSPNNSLDNGGAAKFKSKLPVKK